MNEQNTRYLLHCFDGGGTTGYANFIVDWSPEIDSSLSRVLHWSTREITGSLTSKFKQFRDILLWENEFPHSRQVVVAERFDLSIISKDENVLLAVKDNALLETIYGETGRYYEQPREVAKTTVTNERLHNWGFYVEGSPHRRDAVRIGLTFIRRCSNNPKLKEKYFSGIRVD